MKQVVAAEGLADRLGHALLNEGVVLIEVLLAGVVAVVQGCIVVVGAFV